MIGAFLIGVAVGAAVTCGLLYFVFVAIDDWERKKRQ